MQCSKVVVPSVDARVFANRCSFISLFFEHKRRIIVVYSLFYEADRQMLFDWLVVNLHKVQYVSASFSLFASLSFVLPLCVALANVFLCHKLPFEIAGFLSLTDV